MQKEYRPPQYLRNLYSLLFTGKIHTFCTYFPEKNALLLCFCAGCGGCEPIQNPAAEFFKKLAVNGTQNIVQNTEKNCSRKPQDGCCDRHCAKRIKYCLPFIGSRKSYAHTSDYSNIRKNRRGKQKIEGKKNNTSDNISRNTSLYPAFQIIPERHKY